VNEAGNSKYKCRVVYSYTQKQVTNLNNYYCLQFLYGWMRLNRSHTFYFLPHLYQLEINFLQKLKKKEDELRYVG
jgi:hypothetical protein